jgi:hypothetical protein
MMSLKAALRTYQLREASAQWCAHAAGLSLWEFLDEMKAHGVPFMPDQDSLWEQLNEFRASLDARRAAEGAGPTEKRRRAPRTNVSSSAKKSAEGPPQGQDDAAEVGRR